MGNPQDKVLHQAGVRIVFSSEISEVQSNKKNALWHNDLKGHHRDLPGGDTAAQFGRQAARISFSNVIRVS